MDYDVDKVPSAVKKPLDPPPFRHDEPGFKDKDIPTDDYTRKDNKVAVAPKPPGSVASAKNSLKEGTVKNLPGGPGVKDGVPPPPPKSPQLSKNKPVEPEDASTINDDNISPVLSSKKETQKTVFSYEKPTKDDFLNLEIVTSGGANTRLSSIKNKVLELLPSVKLPRKERYPVDKVANLPTSSKNIPKIQAEKFYSETAKEKTARLDRLDKIKEVFLISWNQYKKFAWGKDEIKPISQEGFDPFAGWSATLVDALDTLLIMGLKDEFDEALEVVRNIDFSTTFRKDIPLFETVIRYLGGLLSAYDLVEPKQPILLEKAIQLGDNLLSAFDTPNRMPKVSFLWTQEAQKFKYRASSSSPFAEIGSMSVEFTRLAQLSGNNSYYDAIDRVTSAIYAMAPVNDIPYLFDQKVDASGCKLVPLPGTMKAEKDLGNSNDDPASDDLKKQKPLKEDKNETIKKASELKNESKDSEEENEEITSTDKQIASKMRSKAEELTKLSNSDDLDQVKPSLNTIKDSPVAKKKVSFGAKAASRNSRDPLSLFSEEDIGTLGKVRKGSDVALREAAKRVNRKGFQKRAFIGDIDEEAVKEAKRIAQSAAKEAKNDLNRVKDSVGKGLESVKSKAELAKEKAEEMADKTKNIIDDTLSSTAKKAKEIADQVPAVKVKEHSDDVSAKTDVATKKVKEIFDEDISKTIVAAKKTKEIIEDNVVTKKVSITSNANGVDKSTPTTISTKLQSSKTKTSVVAETTKDTVQKSSVTSVKETDEALSSLNAASSSASASEKSKKDQLNSDDGSSLKDAIKAEQEIINAPIVNEELSSTATQSSATADKKNKEISEKSNVAEEDIEAGFSAGKTDIKTVINQLGTGRHALFACGPQPALAKIADVKNEPKYTVGGLTDSTYEYFAKEYLLLNGADDRYKELHTNTIEAVNKNLLFKPLVEGDPDILMVGNKIQRTPGFFQDDNEMSHLSCFVGGMYALGGKLFGRPEDVETGAKLTDGCVWAYNVTRSGVMPENFHVRRCPTGDEKCHFNFETVDAEYKAREKVELEKLAAQGVNTKIYSPSTYSVAPNIEVISDGRGGTRWPVSGYYDMPKSFLRMDAKYIMRPEALESVFYLYRITGDRAWQEKGWRMFESIIKLTAIPNPDGSDVPLGYSGVHDVSDDRVGTKGNFRNEAESFWMAETLKYAYLLFSDPDLIGLDDWVLNTEAHPLKRADIQ